MSKQAHLLSLAAAAMALMAGPTIDAQSRGITRAARTAIGRAANAARSTWFTLRLERLECHRTEDRAGSDEAKLALAIDGQHASTWRRELDKKECLRLGAKFRFRREATLNLWDEDSLDPDDHLGTVRIPARSAARGVGRFTKDGARYTIHYVVFPTLATPPPSTPCTLTLKELRCVKTEDSFGSDECELRIWIDGRRIESLRNDLDDGDAWKINRGLGFRESVRVQLWDRDRGGSDGHDLLGSLTMYGTTPARVVNFTNDGACYRLYYEVRHCKTDKRKHRAHALVKSFARSKAAGKFTKLSKARILKQLSARIEKPSIMRQRRAPLCGPVAVLVALARIDPERYVRMARALYETGQFRIGKLCIKPDKHLYCQEARRDVADLDWMLAASMRDSRNVLLDYEGTDSSLDLVAGSTMPWDVKVWFKALLGCSRAVWLPTNVYGEKKAFSRARDAVQSGNVVSLLVDSHMLSKGTIKPVEDGYELTTVGSTGSINISNHLVDLIDVTSLGRRVKFRIVTWGKEVDVDMTTSQFEDFMWGAIIGYR